MRWNRACHQGQRQLQLFFWSCGSCAPTVSNVSIHNLTWYDTDIYQYRYVVILVNMFIAVLMENFETAEEEKRMRQVDQYARQQEHVEKHDPVISRWNIYRYFRAKPKGVNVGNMPTNLVLPAKKTVIRDFMNADMIKVSERDKAGICMFINAMRLLVAC